MNQRDSESLRKEAALWCARLMRPDAEQYRTEFDAWLEADTAHRQAYDRIRGKYERAGVLAWRARADTGAKSERRQWFIGAGLGAGGIAAGVAACAVMLVALTTTQTRLFGPEQGQPAVSGSPASYARPQQLDTKHGEIRVVVLPDGSKVTLDTEARLNLAFNGEERHLTLLQGRARFDVHHETRPFVVMAANGAITARGTIFDIDVRDPGRVQVALLKGAIDVSVRDSGHDRPVVRRLLTGQKTAFASSGFAAPLQPVPQFAADWPTGVLDVEGLPLAQLLAQANRYAPVPIAADSDLGALHVSGRFRIDQPDLLIRNVADLFDLAIDRSEADKIVLKRKL